VLVLKHLEKLSVEGKAPLSDFDMVVPGTFGISCSRMTCSGFVADTRSMHKSRMLTRRLKSCIRVGVRAEMQLQRATYLSASFRASL
jgi:hypothetical protein